MALCCWIDPLLVCLLSIWLRQNISFFENVSKWVGSGRSAFTRGSMDNCHLVRQFSNANLAEARFADGSQPALQCLYPWSAIHVHQNDWRWPSRCAVLAHRHVLWERCKAFLSPHRLGFPHRDNLWALGLGNRQRQARKPERPGAVG